MSVFRPLGPSLCLCLGCALVTRDGLIPMESPQLIPQVREGGPEGLLCGEFKHIRMTEGTLFEESVLGTCWKTRKI